MSRKLSNEKWNEFINLFSSYEGTVSSFCEENNISKTQFYYHKRRIEAASTESTPVFQRMKLKKIVILKLLNLFLKK
ncbi:IS66 family insertion sequence element accessory protein TnpA [Clostridium sp. SGI.024]|uniref:IS66 family insertion sequence element accessory protein TnpA n=2 Tax=unclassified Clostridium TaxID=2614128 RepID=UPI003D02D11A